MDTKHTPGPWVISGRSTINAGRGGWVASVSQSNREANARLIAAAPELLEALRVLEAALIRDMGAGYSGVARCQAAIAKAAGQ